MVKFIFVMLVFGLPVACFGQNTDAEKIKWPAAYEPSKSRFYVHNSIDIYSSPEKTWQILIDVLKWESWYSGAKKVRLKNMSDSALNDQSIFSWKTMGLQLTSTIKEFEPYRLLAWESKKSSIKGYHVWLIIPTDFGCRVITDESQNGWLTFFEKLFQKNKLKKLHDVWLLALKEKSENQ